MVYISTMFGVEKMIIHTDLKINLTNLEKSHESR